MKPEKEYVVFRPHIEEVGRNCKTRLVKAGEFDKKDLLRSYKKHYNQYQSGQFTAYRLVPVELKEVTTIEIVP